MAITQTRTDILGTSSSPKAINSEQNSFTQWTSEPATTGVNCGPNIGLSIYFQCAFGATGTQTNSLEVFTSQDGTNYDTDPYMTYTFAGANSTTKAATIPLFMPEDIPYFKVKVSASTVASSTSNVWVSYIKVTI